MKKFLTITGVVAIAVALFFNVSLSKNNSLRDINLASLTNLNHANAECTVDWTGWIDGHCVSLYYNPTCATGPGGSFDNPIYDCTF